MHSKKASNQARLNLNIIGVLHKELSLPNPLLNNWPLNSQLIGINRSKRLTKNQKQPITPAMLLQLHDRFDLGNSADASFLAICLVAFYDLFCKSHLLLVSTSSFDLRKQLTKADFKIFPWGYSSLFVGVRPGAQNNGQQVARSWWRAKYFLAQTNNVIEQNALSDNCTLLPGLNSMDIQKWPVKMTGKMRVWLFKSTIRPDIVRWPAVILSPEDHTISWTDYRNATPLHSPFQTMSDSSHHKCLSLYHRSILLQLSSVQLGRPKAACKNFTYGSFVSTLRIHLTSLDFDPKLFVACSYPKLPTLAPTLRVTISTLPNLPLS